MPVQPQTSAARTLSAAEIRRQFIDFFIERHGHTFAPSSPVVPHDDPTLLFTNAGMNQFKPIFLGQADPGSEMGRLKRAVNSQKCIRAGGKHNDLDDVGKDLYHHTFFEMLGNWSFGDYFKAEAIAWAWELFTEVWGLDPERLYATYFQGAKPEGLEPDREAYELWQRHLPAQRILPGNMKDNFWEMGDTGPCGPCSEIHYDGRSDAERARTPGHTLVNRESPDVIELWNLVFIQFNRTGEGAAGLKPLPAKHVDTGLGLERITRVLQGKQSNYDTDVFTPLFERISKVCAAAPYGGKLDDPKDIAYRVIADHIRTLTFAIADGADPGNDGRNYVLRRILRRAVKYGHQNLEARGPFLCELVPTVVETMGEFFPELKKEPARIMSVIRDEEEAFNRTIERGVGELLSAVGLAFARHFVREQEQNPQNHHYVYVNTGTFKLENEAFSSESGDIQLIMPAHTTFEILNAQSFLGGGQPKPVEAFRLDELSPKHIERWCGSSPSIDAITAFKLHDTYGFPIDLTQIMAEERGLTVDVEGFNRLMEEAREKARSGGASTEQAHPASTLPGDAVARLNNLRIKPTNDEAKFENKSIRANIRAIWNGTDFDENTHASHMKPGDRIGVVLDRTCFYAEMGGQVGDSGRLVVTREAQSSVRDGATGGEIRVEDTRAFGGYVLHIGRVSKGEIRVGDQVSCELEKRRRQAVMANHTGTHLLNFALREVLGERVDQKGSLVAPDRLRFDFSHAAAVKPEEMERIEAIVREKINLDLPVCADTAPLPLAKKVNGLRAVFGEAYPDPVRIVSIGAPVSALVQEPDSDNWRKLSIELCGGTHVQSTSEIQHFVITEESGIAKGVRRMAALTGAAAGEAVENARAIEHALDEAKKLDDDAIEARAADLLHQIEAATLPLGARRLLGQKLEALQDRVKAAKKQHAAAGREAAVDAARRIAEESQGAVIVEALPGDDAGADRQAMLSALDAIRAKRTESAVMLLGADRENGKLTIVANVPKELIGKGLKAGDWVRAAAEACGGKGGGRPDSAQGGGTQPEKMGDAIEAAKTFAQSKL